MIIDGFPHCGHDAASDGGHGGPSPLRYSDPMLNRCLMVESIIGLRQTFSLPSSIFFMILPWLYFLTHAGLEPATPSLEG